MMRNRRVGTLPHAREGSGPRVESIDPPLASALVHMDLQHSDDNALGPELINNSLLPPFDRTDQRLVNLLFRIRTNNYLKSLAKFSGPNRRRSSARFFTDIAAVTSLLTTCVCDILFLSYSRHSVRSIQRQHGPTLQAFDLTHGLVEHPSILSEFGYSAEQAASTVQQLGRFAGTGGLQHCAADDISLRRAADIRPRVPEEVPFMPNSWCRDCSS
jgi:hypothetical protein